MTRWVVLLRGINVGGANRLAMADLRATAESLGWTGVETYLQSGNLIVTADGTEGEMSAALRVALRERHGLEVPVVIRSAAEFATAATSHPDADAGIDPKLLHVVFLDRHPDGARVDGLDGTRFAPDRFVLDGREVCVSYPNGSARSKLTIDVFERAWGVTATGRNLNTVRRLARMSAG